MTTEQLITKIDILTDKIYHLELTVEILRISDKAHRVHNAALLSELEAYRGNINAELELFQHKLRRSGDKS
jgi:hypothetical protein